jgi:hypothetical protein
MVLDIQNCPISDSQKERVMDIREIEQGLKKPGKSKIGLAKALGRSPSVVSEILRKDGKPRQIKADEVPIIRDYLGLDPVARIVGYVGASSQEVYYAGADDPAETVPMPQGASPDTVAVEIRGDSLGAGLNGWVAFYDDRREPVTQNLLGKLCVVGLPDGRVLIKILRQAPGRKFHLLPNGAGEAILDQRVEWAAKVIHLAPKP